MAPFYAFARCTSCDSYCVNYSSIEDCFFCHNCELPEEIYAVKRAIIGSPVLSESAYQISHQSHADRHRFKLGEYDENSPNTYGYCEKCRYRAGIHELFFLTRIESVCTNSPALLIKLRGKNLDGRKETFTRGTVPASPV